MDNQSQRFREWIKNHPDVWHEDEFETPHWWWVQNCLGSLDIFTWEQLKEIQDNMKPNEKPRE